MARRVTSRMTTKIARTDTVHDNRDNAMKSTTKMDEVNAMTIKRIMKLNMTTDMTMSMTMIKTMVVTMTLIMAVENMS